MKSSAYSYGFGGYGFGNISVALSQILYSSPFTYTLDATNNTLATNKGSFDDAEVFSGGGLELGATNELPVPIPYTLGSEEITNGDFATDTDWTKEAGWTIGSGVATSSGTAYARLYQSTVTTSGNYYLVEFDVTAYTSGDLQVYDNGDWTTISSSLDSFSIVIYATTDIFYLRAEATSPFIGSIDNVSIKQITNPNSFLTLVNGDGTVEQIGNSVDGGSSEELISGNVDTLGAGVTIVGNELVFDGTSGLTYMEQDLFQSGRNGRFIFEITEYTSGSIKFYTGAGTDTATYRSSVGTFMENMIGDGYDLVYYGNNFAGKIKISTMSVKEILPTSTEYDLINQTVLEAMPTTKELTTADLALIEADTSLMGRLALGATDTGLSLVTVDVYGHYAFMEYSGAYCVETTAGYGVINENLTLGISAIDGVGNTISNNGLDIHTIHQDGATTNVSRPYIYPEASANGVLCKLTRIVTVTNGTAVTDDVWVAGDEISGGIQVTAGESLTESIIGYPSTSGWYQTWMMGASSENTYPLDYTIQFILEEATAIEISNYTSTIRTNVDFNPKGNQGIEFERDGVGVPTVYNNTQQNWHGDGYEDLGFMPPSDEPWEMDLMMYCVADGIYSLNGAFTSTSTERLYVGQHTGNGLFLQLGDSFVGSGSTAVSNGWHHIRIEFDGSGNGNLVIDNTTEYAYTLSNYNYSVLESFFIGGTSRLKTLYSHELTQPTGYFQYVEKVRTTAERDADFDEAAGLRDGNGVLLRDGNGDVITII